MQDQTPIQSPAPEGEGGGVFPHLIELRERLMLCVGLLAVMTGVCYHYHEVIFSVLIAPLSTAMGAHGTQRLIYTSLTEAFTTSLKISFLTALYLTLPVILNQIWRFVAPGLYGKERRAFMPFLVATPLLFTLGACMVYFLVMPMAWQFFLGFQTSAGETVLPIQLEPRIGDYLDLIILLIFAFGLCFQLPVFLMLLARVGLVSAQSLVAKRKYMIVLAFVIGAVLTPPDVLSQTLLALPLYGLYELSIFLIRRTERSSRTEEPEAA